MKSFTFEVGPYTVTSYGKGAAIAIARGNHDVAYMQGDDATDLLDELDSASTNRAAVAILARYEEC